MLIKSSPWLLKKAIMSFKSQTGFHGHHTVAASSDPRENVKLIK